MFRLVKMVFLEMVFLFPAKTEKGGLDENGEHDASTFSRENQGALLLRPGKSTKRAKRRVSLTQKHCCQKLKRTSQLSSIVTDFAMDVSAKTDGVCD